jgi:FkbM family methyltransferase
MIEIDVREITPRPIKNVLRYFQHCLTWDNFFKRSWSQEGEDLVLLRLLDRGNLRDGFYIDVGAHHPRRFSNTYAFYRKGWRGINIDAMPGSMKLFNRQRPRDINLEIPVAVEQTQLTYFQFNEPALNTFSKELATSRDGFRSYRVINTQNIQAYPLKTILNQHIDPGQSIDFMSIDVEGLDLDVLQSNDWSKYRPNIILVELLKSSLDSIHQDPIYLFLKDRKYHLYSKTMNTVFFVSDEFLK